MFYTVCAYVCVCVFTCVCLPSAVLQCGTPCVHAARSRWDSLSSSVFFLRIGEVKCMLAEKPANSCSCALLTLGKSVGEDGGCAKRETPCVK